MQDLISQEEKMEQFIAEVNDTSTLF